jgi:Bromodomain
MEHSSDVSNVSISLQEDMESTVAEDIRSIDSPNDDFERMVESALYRCTAGLPKRELRLLIQEVNECEALLLEDIRILEEALNEQSPDEDPSKSSVVSILLESPLTPLDRYGTVSALLGRLRQDMAVPSLSSINGSNINATSSTKPVPSAVEEEKLWQPLTQESHPLSNVYSQVIVPSNSLLNLWKKISSNRAAFVFKRPVKSEEAPGYTDRIHFPMDLSLIRQRIVTNNIQTYADLHRALGLISHNCVKYNGTSIGL